MVGQTLVVEVRMWWEVHWVGVAQMLMCQEGEAQVVEGAQAYPEVALTFQVVQLRSPLKMLEEEGVQEGVVLIAWVVEVRQQTTGEACLPAREDSVQPEDVLQLFRDARPCYPF